jgi:hypothetical protein
MLLGKPEERVIIMAPVGQDAVAMAATLKAEGFQTEIAGSLAECCEKISDGAGALLFTEEALGFAQIS